MSLQFLLGVWRGQEKIIAGKLHNKREVEFKEWRMTKIEKSRENVLTKYGSTILNFVMKFMEWIADVLSRSSIQLRYAWDI